MPTKSDATDGPELADTPGGVVDPDGKVVSKRSYGEEADPAVVAGPDGRPGTATAVGADVEFPPPAAD